LSEKKRFGRNDLEKYLSILEGIEEIDLSKVRRIKKQIEEGRYRVNPQAVAEKMLEDLLKDGGATGSSG